jgi:lipopolysaccharide export system permease protein
MFTLFAFILYFNLLNIGQRWVGSGQLSLSSLLLLLHGSVFVLCVVWLVKRQRNFSLRGWLQLRLRTETVEQIGKAA